MYVCMCTDVVCVMVVMCMRCGGDVCKCVCVVWCIMYVCLSVCDHLPSVPVAVT